jgi:hypothetical protein
VQNSCVAGSPAADDASCNGVDNDCNGSKDEDYVPQATSCGVGACASTGVRSCVGGVEQNSCTPGSPAANDASCNNVDDDCAGGVDEDYVSQATSCGVGACAATGSTSCSSGAIVDSCTPGTPAADDASCNGVDNDCNGSKDEDYVPSGTVCGTGSCASTGTKSCVNGTEQDSCTPGIAEEEDVICDGEDEDCDGDPDDDYVDTETSCGLGVCASTGMLTCVDGAEEDSCTAGEPADIVDFSCDDVDQDCDGDPDDDYVDIPNTCGVGPCASTGALSCVDGGIVDSCVPGAPAPSDSVCDGVDEDCSGEPDEDFTSAATSCGVGACASTGMSSCISGVLDEGCTVGAPLASDDTTCDAIDDDCSGEADEDYLEAVTSCGDGACARTGNMQCISGTETDSCDPGAPAANDRSCNDSDDDCDGNVDEDYQPSETTCGVGACGSTGLTSCVDGDEEDNCTPAEPLAVDDTTCDHVDDNCNGRIDEDAVCEPDAGVDAGGAPDAGFDAGAPTAGSGGMPAGGGPNSPDEDAGAEAGSGGKPGGNSGGTDAGTLVPIDLTAIGDETTDKGCACSLPGQRSLGAPWALWAAASFLSVFVLRRRGCGLVNDAV